MFEFSYTRKADVEMEPGPPSRSARRADALVQAAARAQTLEDLAELLRDLRRRHAHNRRDSSLTYRELADRTGWSTTSVAQYFTAHTLPPTDRFDALLEVLGAVPAERRALANARDRVEEAHYQARDRRPASRAPAATAPGRSRTPAPTVTSVPRQLPAAPRLFTGRAVELARLSAALDAPPAQDRTLAISAIGGTGGIGKTWLAVHWAYQNLDLFPDGQLYVDLRGFDPAEDPLPSQTAVRGFLEALGADLGAIPAGLEAQAGLYRSLLVGKRMLIVLDNARDTGQVTALLPGTPTCTVLVTSRRKLTGLVTTRGARLVELDVLPRGEARRLLARHLGRTRLAAESDAVDTLLACCAGLPLALSIVAARAATDPGLPLASLAAELLDHRHRLDALDGGEPQANLRAVLSCSSQALSAQAAAAFALLGTAPGPDIGLAAAANLLALPSAATRSLLRELEHAHLTQRHAPDRYRMHDLLRLHATERARETNTEADRLAALRRLVDYYVYTAHAGGRLLTAQHPMQHLGGPDAGHVAQPLPDVAAAVAWFDTEHAGLLAALQLACSHGWDPQVCHLAWALDPFHRQRGHRADQAATWQLAVISAQRLGEPALRIRAHQMLGDAYAQLGRTTDALDQLRQALALAEPIGDIASQAEIHHSLGGMWERHGDERRALEHAERALEVFRKLGDSYRQARALNAVGWLQLRLGDHTAARANCEAALALLREHPSTGRQLVESNTLDSLGCIAYHLHQYDQALDYYDQALAVCRAHGHSDLEADVLYGIAETRLAQHRPEQARDIWQQALELYTAQHRLADVQRVTRSLAAFEHD